MLSLLAGPDHNPLDREDYVAVGLAVEELAYADFNLANAAIPVLLMTSLLAAHADEATRERWLPRLMAGETYVAFGLTEPHAGSDAAAIRTTAAADADGYLLTGEKTSVTMLAHAEAMLVAAQHRARRRAVGVSVFLVDLDAAASPPPTSPTPGGGRWGAARCTSTASGCRPTRASASRDRRSAACSAASTSPARCWP